VLRAVRRRHDVDEDRIVLGGVSRGGHMTWDMALRNPDLFAGLIAVNGSPRLGQWFWDNNMAFLEGLPAVAVRAVQWGDREPIQVANQKRALRLLERYGNKDARLLTVKDLAAAFAAKEADWESFFAHRRSFAATLVRMPAIGDVPLAAHFGRRRWFDVVRTDPELKIKWPMQVPASKWNRLDEQSRRDLMDDYVRDLRPRLQIERARPGRFIVTERSIHAFRLLLTPDLCDAKGDVVVIWHGKELRRHPEPSATVLLRDFAECFDRTFLPVLEVVLP
jgi:pimeloyl-ACP methyl ester carboxylesterase